MPSRAAAATSATAELIAPFKPNKSSFEVFAVKASQSPVMRAGEDVSDG